MPHLSFPPACHPAAVCPSIFLHICPLFSDMGSRQKKQKHIPPADISDDMLIPCFPLMISQPGPQPGKTWLRNQLHRFFHYCHKSIRRHGRKTSRKGDFTPRQGLTRTPYNATVFRKCIPVCRRKTSAGMKAPDRKAGPIYTFNLVYAVRRCVPWKRKIWIGPI